MNKNHITASLFLLFFTSIALAGEFGDHCTTGLSKGALIKTKCNVNEVFEGKTYCFGSEGARDSFLFDPKDTIKKAEAFYATNPETERQKISQADAQAMIKSKDCVLSNKDLSSLNFSNMSLGHCKMVNVSLFGTDLRGASLKGANLQGAFLNLARLEHADFTNANLTDASIYQAIFDQTNFHSADLTNARVIGPLGNVDMIGAIVKNGQFGVDIGNQPMGQMRFDSVAGKFEQADFENADLNRANFSFANLRGANLRGVNMFRTDLTQADLTGADITGANFDEAVVDDTIFKDVKGLESVKGFATVKGKCKDCTAKIAATSAPQSATKLAENVPVCVLDKH